MLDPEVIEYESDSDDVQDVSNQEVEIQESIDQLLQAKLSPQVRAFREFMHAGNFRTEKGDPCTNIIDNTDKRNYIVPPTRITTFFEKLEACRMDGRTMHFAERQSTKDVERTGIVIDIDIFQKVGNRLVTSRHLSSLIQRITRILVKTLEFHPEEKEGMAGLTFYAFVISRTAVTACDDKTYKDGFHIIIPEIQVSREYKRYLIEVMLKEDVVNSAMRDIMPQIAKPEKLLDKQSACNPINFVGSAKAGATAYPLTHAFCMEADLSGDDFITPTPVPDVNSLANGYSPEGHPINLVYELSIGFFLEFIGDQRTWLKKTEYEYRKELEPVIQIRAEKTLGGILDEEEIEDNEAEVDILTTGNAEASYIKKLLGIIDLSYATEYEKWFKVICAIANTNPRYKSLAVWFSHRNPKCWSPTEIERVWGEGLNARGARSPVTKRSIIFWAKESSPERFSEIERENYLTILARAVFQYDGKINHAETARVIYSMVGNKFACDVSANDKTGLKREWYEFVLPEQAHKEGEVYKWRREDDPDALRCFMADHLPKVYNVQLERIKDHKERAESADERKYWSGVEKNLKASQEKLGDDTTQTKILNQCKLRFRIRGFTEELDSYPNVIGVGNGVLILGAKPVLLQRFHEYYISKYTPTKYRPYNPANPYVKELLAIIHDIIVEDDAFEFIMFYLATAIDLAEVAGMWLQIVGGGRNGKSFLTKMLYYTMGEKYIAQFRSELLTGDEPKANAANSAKMVLRGKTGAYCDEFNSNEVVNSKLTKSIANPGRTTGRDNWEYESSFRNTVNLIASTNHELSTADTDYGFWRRVRYYIARVRFIENPNPSNPYEKKVNTKIMDEYPFDKAYQEAFLSILVHYHSRLHIEYGGDIKKVPCPTIERQTEEYHNRQDSLNRFINLNIVKSPNASPILLEELGNEYISWYRNNVQSSTSFKMQTLIEQFVTSKLVDSIKPRDDGTRELRGHRLRESIDEPLQEGESFLFVPVNSASSAPPPPPGGEAETTPAPSVLQNVQAADDGEDWVDLEAEMATPVPRQNKAADNAKKYAGRGAPVRRATTVRRSYK